MDNLELPTLTVTGKLPADFDLKNCKRCSLCQSRLQVVAPVIVQDSKVLIIGSAPSLDDDRNGIPFVGRSGELLNRMLEQSGISRSQCSLHNVVACRPKDNKPPEANEIEACHDILEDVIDKVKPQIIVTLGNPALKRITKKSGITKYNGKLLEHDNYPGVKIIPIVDPAFVLRDAKNERMMLEAFRRVKSILDGEAQEKKSVVTYVDTPEKFRSMIADLKSTKYFATDIETDGLNFKDNNVISIGFCNRKGYSYVIPWVIGDKKYNDFCRQFANTKRREAINNIPDFCANYGLNVPTFFWKDHPDLITLLKDLFEDTKIDKLLHNYMFDYKFLKRAGMIIKGRIWDTMILHYLLDETRGTHGLDDCCLSFTDYGEYWKDIDKFIIKTKERMDSYAIIPIDILSLYNGTDTDVTFQIFEKFIPRIVEEGFVNLYTGFMFPLSQLLLETEENGILMDETYNNSCQLKLTSLIQEIDTRIEEFTKNVVYDPEKPEVKGINLNSVPQLKYFLFDYLKLPVINRTDKGEPSTDEATLEQLQSVSDVAKLLLERRKMVKLLSTYFVGFKVACWNDGKVHPSFLLIGTETGRLAARNPNVQNMPRNPEEGSKLYDLNIRVRDMFICSESDEFCIVETDYSQAELRLIAEYSRDKNLYRAFMEGRDPHAELAVRIYHKDKVHLMESGQVKAEDIVTKEERQKAKTANFSLVYGKAAINFATENGIPLDEAEYIHRVYWATYTGITTWKEQELIKGRQQGYFQSFFGRKRRSRKIYSDDLRLRAEAEREGINFLIQSQASDYTLWSTMTTLEKARQFGLDVRPISFVHDSAVFEVRKTHLQDFLTLLNIIMLNPPGISIPMESEVKVGYRLGSLDKWFKDNDDVWKIKAKKK